MRATLATLLLLPILAGCEDLILDPGTDRLDGRYDVVWSWRIDAVGLPAEHGSCDGMLRLDRRTHDQLDGHHELPPLATCLPRRSGDVLAAADRYGDLRLALRLSDGTWGVFERDADCSLRWADDVLRGETDADGFRADAEARYRCPVGGTWRDVDVRLELDARRRGLW